MNQIKHNMKDNYTKIPNEAIYDKSLSAVTIRIFLIFLSKPDHWTFHNKVLANEAGITEDTLRKKIDELINSGWLTRIRLREFGKFKGYEYVTNYPKITT